MKEIDLYPPVKQLLEQSGYEIKAEVKDVDIAAMKKKKLLIVELKTSINLKLLMQVAKRQRMTDFVYAAVPRPISKKRFNKDFEDRKYLLRRLGVGLILVAMDADIPYAAVEFEPTVLNMAKSRAASSGKTKALINEMKSRSSNQNKGGSTQTKLVTAYREKALKIAYHLEGKSCMKTGELKDAGCPPETTRMLYDNYYGWFERTGRAQYRLSDKGQIALKKYSNVLEYIKVKD